MIRRVVHPDRARRSVAVPSDLSVSRTLLSNLVGCCVPGSKPTSKSSSLTRSPAACGPRRRPASRRVSPKTTCFVRRRLEAVHAIAAEPDLLGLAVDGHLEPAGGDLLVHLALRDFHRHADVLLDPRGEIVVDLEADGHRHVGVAAEGDDRLASRDRPGGSQLGPALLAPAVDAIVQALIAARAIQGEDVDLAEAAVDLGVDRSGRPCNGSPPAEACGPPRLSCDGIRFGTIGRFASAMCVAGSPPPFWILNSAMGIGSEPSIPIEAALPGSGSRTISVRLTVRSLSGSVTDLPSWPSSGQS